MGRANEECKVKKPLGIQAWGRVGRMGKRPGGVHGDGGHSAGCGLIGNELVLP